MGVRFPSVISSAQVNPLPASAAETVVCTTPPLTLPQDGATIFLTSTVFILAGTGTTAIILQIRRGTLVTSTLVSPAGTHTLAAGSSAVLCMSFFDGVTAAFGGVQYSLTIQQTGATAAGTLNLQTLAAFCL